MGSGLVWPARPNFSFGEDSAVMISGDEKLGLVAQTGCGPVCHAAYWRC